MTARLDGVTVRYGERVAVADIDLDFPVGICGLLGRNGAGKSSILKAMLGLVRPAAGRVQVLDVPADAPGTVLRERVGYMPERDAHLPRASGFEMVALLGRLSGMPRRDAWRRAHEALYLVGLEEERYRSVATYSAGMRQKAKLAAALVHDPEVLFLDEPTNGLDPAGRSEMLELIRQLGKEHGKSIVLSTHILQDVESVCDHVIVLEAGRVVVRGALADVTRSAGQEFGFEVAPVDLTLPAKFGDGVVVREHSEGRYTATLEPGVAPGCVFAAVAAVGGAVRRFGQVRRSLESTFLASVAGHAAARGAAAPTVGESLGDRPSRQESDS